MSWNVWNRPSVSFMVDMGISSNIMRSPSPKCYMTFWDMTIYNDTLIWLDITPICELITELDFILLSNFGGFHRTLQRMRLANRGRLLLRTPGPVPFGTFICSNVETILSWTCHVYGPFEFRTSLGTSILLNTIFCNLIININYIVFVIHINKDHIWCKCTIINYAWLCKAVVGMILRGSSSRSWNLNKLCTCTWKPSSCVF